MSVDQQFTVLYEKIQGLVRQYNRLEKENDKLREELESSKMKEAETQGKVTELQQQVSILKLAAGEMSDKDKKVFERQLNQFIREIDKTISYLSE
jgi:regulator of replication initiation timing